MIEPDLRRKLPAPEQSSPESSWAPCSCGYAFACREKRPCLANQEGLDGCRCLHKRLLHRTFPVAHSPAIQNLNHDHGAQGGGLIIWALKDLIFYDDFSGPKGDMIAAALRLPSGFRKAYSSPSVVLSDAPPLDLSLIHLLNHNKTRATLETIRG